MAYKLFGGLVPVCTQQVVNKLETESFVCWGAPTCGFAVAVLRVALYIIQSNCTESCNVTMQFLSCSANTVHRKAPPPRCPVLEISRLGEADRTTVRC